MTEDFRTTDFNTLMEILLALKGSQHDMMLFKAAWSWVIADVKHVSYLEEILRVVKVPDITFQELMDLGNRRAAAPGTDVGNYSVEGLSISQLQAAAAMQGGGNAGEVGSLDFGPVGEGEKQGFARGSNASQYSSLPAQAVQQAMGGSVYAAGLPVGDALTSRKSSSLPRAGSALEDDTTLDGFQGYHGDAGHVYNNSLSKPASQRGSPDMLPGQLSLSSYPIAGALAAGGALEGAGDHAGAGGAYPTGKYLGDVGGSGQDVTPPGGRNGRFSAMSDYMTGDDVDRAEVSGRGGKYGTDDSGGDGNGARGREVSGQDEAW